MDMQNTPSAMSGHVQVLLCKKLNSSVKTNGVQTQKTLLIPAGAISYLTTVPYSDMKASDRGVKNRMRIKSNKTN